MASITIRRLDDAVKEKLRVRAAKHGVLMEEEARELLKVGLARPDTKGMTFSESIRAYFEPLGGPGQIRRPRSFFRRTSPACICSIVSSKQRIGRPMSQFNGMIAAIARVHGASIATQDIADFEHCGIPLVNPWKHARH